MGAVSVVSVSVAGLMVLESVATKVAGDVLLGCGDISSVRTTNGGEFIQACSPSLVICETVTTGVCCITGVGASIGYC